MPDRITDSLDEDAPGLQLDEIDSIMATEEQRARNIPAPPVTFPVEGFDLKSYIAEIEISIIQTALDNSDGVIAHAAKALGLRRTTLAEKMRKYHIERPTHHAAEVSAA